jgi:N-acetylglucosaminyldiphosphoundecaprenol N-acetyl-beta-D-mannosaminyltransferase
MGVPLQEKIAFELSKRINGLQIICVGNFLEFYFGTIKRAPKFLHNSGFEWIFRLLTEPRRLWKRYLIGIPVFIARIILLIKKMEAN